LDLLWLLPLSLLVLISVFSYANTDTTRDFLLAWQISQGEHWPLLGPQMAFSFDIAPWWFYLLSLPLQLENSWLSLAVMTALLNGSKFFLAYRLGQRLHDKLLGLCLLAGLLLFSLNVMQTVTFTHTNLVEPLMLLIMGLSSHPAMAERHWRWLWLGMLLGLTFHAHPTALMVGYFVLLAWSKSRYKSDHAALLTLGMVLMFVPVIIHSLMSAESQLSGVSQYLDKHLNSFSMTAYINTLWGLWISAPHAMLNALFGSDWTVIIMGVQWLIQGIAVLAPVLFHSSLSPRLKNMLFHLWVFLLLSVLGLVLIRSNTPWYMTYGAGLTISLITGVGLYVWLMNIQHSLLRTAPLIVLAVIFLSTQTQTARHLNNSTLQVPSLVLNDVKNRDDSLFGFSYEIMALKASAHGAYTCDNQPVAVHGPYSNLLYAHSGMEHLAECGEGLYYGPAEGATPLAGVPPQFSQLIDAPVISQIGNTSFYHPVDVSDQQLVWEETYRHDYQRKLSLNPNWRDEPVTTTLAGGKHLIITNLPGFKMPLQVLEVQANDQIIGLAASSIYATLYLCTNCQSEQTSWQVTYLEGARGMTNVVSF
jgi:hypothetical protein